MTATRSCSGNGDHASPGCAGAPSDREPAEGGFEHYLLVRVDDGRVSLQVLEPWCLCVTMGPVMADGSATARVSNYDATDLAVTVEFPSDALGRKPVARAAVAYNGKTQQASATVIPSACPASEVVFFVDFRRVFPVEVSMTTLSRSIAIAAAVAACSAALLAQTPALDIKVGLWEMTMTTKVGGDMPTLDMSKLTSEQRTRMQEAMKQFMGTHTTTHKSCITKADLQKGAFLGDDQPNCKTTVVKNTSTVLDAHQTCTGDDASTNNLHFEAASPTTVTGTVKSTNTSDGKTMNVEGTIAARWLGAECGDVK